MMRQDLNLADATNLIYRWARLGGVDVRTVAQAVVKSVSFDADLPDPEVSLARLIAGSGESLLG